MKLLVLCHGKIGKDKKDISCYSDVLNYYLPPSLSKYADCDIKTVSSDRNYNSGQLEKEINAINFSGYDVILVLGLRFFSKVPKHIIPNIRKRFKGLICQTHDGSRFNNDQVDITFTTKNEDNKWKNTGWWENHKKYNHYSGWAADSELNRPLQDNDELRILIDHTNYGNNKIDDTKEIIKQVKRLVTSRKWETKFKSIRVRRFISGGTEDVNFNQTGDIEKFDRSKVIPITEITKEHNKAHIFMVTHPESVGLVVLETSLAGGFIVSPSGYISRDRLQTVRHYSYKPKSNIDWDMVLKSIDPRLSRNVALKNNWDNVAKRIIEKLKKEIT